MKKILKILALILAFLFFFWLFQTETFDLSALKNLSFPAILFFLLLLIPALALNAVFLRLVFKSLDENLSLADSFNLVVLRRLSNYLLSKSGLFLSGAYLKKYHAISFKKTLAYALYLNLVQLLVWLAFTAAALLSLKIFNPISIGAVVLLALCALLIFHPRLFRFLPGSKIKAAVENWSAFFSPVKTVLLSLLIWTLIAALSSIRMIVLFHALGYDISWLKIAAINSLGMLSAVFAITPAALGVKEAAMGLTAGLLGEALPAAVLAAALDRVLTLAVILVFSLLLIFKHKYKDYDKKI